MQADLIAALTAIVGRSYVLTRPEELMLYEFDGSVLDLATPDLVVVPATTAEVAGCLRIAATFGVPIVARGAGTGLAGGSVPITGGIVLSTARLNRVLTIDPTARTATVQPGLVNVELSSATAPFGLHFAPDPSSQRSSTIGGNVATNAGGPHCLKYGVTANHVLAVTLVLAGGQVLRVGGAGADAPGYDLLGVVVGSEGTLGVVTEVVVRLTPNPEAVHTALAIFDQMEQAGACVSAIIAAGVIPAALEMIVGEGIAAIEAAVHAGYPTDARAVLLIELDGLRENVRSEAAQIELICTRFGARALQSARNEAQRAKLWAGRKGALAACARIKPHYHIQDGVVPRSRLPELLTLTETVARRYNLVVVNIFHAGDGNLHPLLLFDLREPGVRERAMAAGEEILRACVDAGGTISGEHGIGLEKREYLRWVFSADDLTAFDQLRACFDPTGQMNPCKLLPMGASCGEITHAHGAQRAMARGDWI